MRHGVHSASTKLSSFDQWISREMRNVAPMFGQFNKKLRDSFGSKLYVLEYLDGDTGHKLHEVFVFVRNDIDC
jgi:hypothetical protein